MNLDLIKEEFDNYVKNFDMESYDINYKYKHSYRVYKISESISEGLNLNGEDILLASVIGLLHDIGRFEQLKEYSSYNDINLDHADYGAKLLFQHNLIKKFNIDKKYYDIIEFAIRNHNKYEIEDTNDNRKLMFAKIVRDADKIDILKAHAIYCDYKIQETEEDISNKVKDTFYNEKQINRIDKKTSNDGILLLLALIFDINFKVSAYLIEDGNIVNELYDKLKNKDRFKEFFNYIKIYLDEKVK